MSVKVAVEVIMKRYLQVTFEEVLERRLERRYVRLVIDIKCVSQVKSPVKTE